MKGIYQPNEIEMVNNIELSIVGVQELLPERSVKSIRVRTHQLLKAKNNHKKARTINMSKIERERYIISKIGTKTPTELAHELSVSRRVIYDTCKNYGVEITPMYKNLEMNIIKNGYPSGEEERNRYILANIETKTLDELADNLKISVNDVLNICTREVSIELYRRKKVGWKNKSRNKGKRKARLTL